VGNTNSPYFKKIALSACACRLFLLKFFKKKKWAILTALILKNCTFGLCVPSVSPEVFYKKKGLFCAGEEVEDEIEKETYL
jgi:hypothetical protein